MGGGNTASKLRAGCVPRMRRDKKDMPEGEKHTWRKHGMLISGSSTGKIFGVPSEELLDKLEAVSQAVTLQKGEILNKKGNARPCCRF